MAGEKPTTPLPLRNVITAEVSTVLGGGSFAENDTTARRRLDGWVRPADAHDEVADHRQTIVSTLAGPCPGRQPVRWPRWGLAQSSSLATMHIECGGAKPGAWPSLTPKPSRRR